MRTLLLLAMLFAGLPALADEAPMLADARKVAGSVPPRRLQVLSDEIARGGPESAIGVCREKAPELARAASEQAHRCTAVRCRRVSWKRSPTSLSAEGTA